MSYGTILERGFNVLMSFSRIMRGLIRSCSFHLQGKTPNVKLETWNAGLYMVITLMRAFVTSHASDLQTLRAVTDFPLLPTVPKGARWEHVFMGGVHCEYAWPIRSGYERKIEKLLLHQERVVLYLHGGGGALCSSLTHRWITHGIAVRCDSVVIVPNYRRVPEVSLSHSLDDALAVYSDLLKIVPASKVCIAGDSAGGTLAVLAMRKMRELEIQLPACATLLSPWCDIKEVPKVPSPADYLTQEVIAFMIDLLKGENKIGDDLSEWNPMDIDVEGFPPLLIQYGDSELFAEQIRKFSKICTIAAIKTDVLEYHEMVHIPHFFSCLSKEGDRALDDLGDFVKSRICFCE
jgi:monoterpene epsilon-lactone hydrolase